MTPPKVAPQVAAGRDYRRRPLAPLLQWGIMSGMETLYAYLAGAIDADGFISIGKRAGSRRKADGTTPFYYVIKIGLSETSPIIPELLHQTFPGWYGTHQPKNPAHKRWYIWHAENAKAEAPLRALLPHLRLKRRQAEIALAFVDLLREQNTGRFMGNRLSDEQEAARHTLYAELSRLNAPRNRRVHFDTSTIPFLPSGT